MRYRDEVMNFLNTDKYWRFIPTYNVAIIHLNVSIQLSRKNFFIMMLYLDPESFLCLIITTLVQPLSTELTRVCRDCK